MKRTLFLATVLILSISLFSQESIQLIGLDIDQSQLAAQSYGSQYDEGQNKKPVGYMPYATIAVVRKYDSVVVIRRPYLVIPTCVGFKYATLESSVVENDTTAIDPEDDNAAAQKAYTISDIQVEPVFFTSKAKITQFIKKQTSPAGEALTVNFERFSYITPDYYFTEGFDSEVTFTATWFNAQEKCNVYSFNPNVKSPGNRYLNYFGRKATNAQIIQTLKKRPKEYPGKITESYELPWGGLIKDHTDVFFTLMTENDQVKIQPLTLLNGNSARSFLQKGSAFVDAKVLAAIKVKANRPATTEKLAFTSPDGKTKVVIETNILKVFDIASGRLLQKQKLPAFNKVIMSEWALGKYVNAWFDKL